MTKFGLILFLLVGCTMHTSAQPPGQNTGSQSKVTDVWVVFKTHFDLGFTDLPENVFKRYREEMMDKDGYWTAGYHVVVVFGYNTKLVRKDDVPKSYDDLLNPRWKGKMVFDTQDADWFHTLLEYFGEEKGLSLSATRRIRPFSSPGSS